MLIKLRNMEFARASVTTLKQTALVPEVGQALVAWVNAKWAGEVPGVLIGGLAMSFYARPRATEDVDLLFLVESDIPEKIPGFKRHRHGAFQENKHHVEIEVCTPQSIHLPETIAQLVYKTAVVHDGLRVASLEALIVLKLYGSDTPKRLHLDLGDVDRLVQAHPSVVLDTWPVSKAHLFKFEEAKQRARI